MHSESNTGHFNSSAVNGELNMEELLARVAGRDATALGSLYDRFAPALMGLLMRMMSADLDAGNALQEVFLRLWKEAPSIVQSKGSLAAWLVLTARHVALQHLRAQRAGGSRPAQSLTGQGHPQKSEPLGKPAGTGRKEEKARDRRSTKRNSRTLSFLIECTEVWIPRPEDIALVDARLGLLQRAFNQMPKPQRLALELAVFGGHTESEIAEQLDEPLGRVRAGLRAAFTFLRHRQQAVLGTWTANI